MENPEEKLAPINFDKLTPPLKPATATNTPPTSYLLNRSYYGGYSAEEALANERTNEPPAERPLGVTIVSALNFIAVVFYAFLFLVATQARGERGSSGVAFIAVLSIIMGVAVGVGLWRLKVWGYWLAVIGYGFSLASSLIGNFNEELTGRSLLGILIPMAIIAYLLQKDVHETFNDY